MAISTTQNQYYNKFCQLLVSSQLIKGFFFAIRYNKVFGHLTTFNIVIQVFKNYQNTNSYLSPLVKTFYLKNSKNYFTIRNKFK